jgi:hypothetical protein
MHAWKRNDVKWPHYTGQGPTWTHAKSGVTIEGWATHVNGRRGRLTKRRAHHVLVNGHWIDGPWGFDGFREAKAWAERVVLDANGGVLETCLVEVTDGVVRWKSNGRVPFPDKLTDLYFRGLDFDFQRSVEARRADDQAFLAQARLLPRDDSGEAQFERRAAFGAGQTVVDVITGHTYQT